LDVRRHLGDQPILARAPSTLYRFRKFLRRHRAWAAAALVLTILISGLMIALAKWNQKRLLDAEKESIQHRQILSQIRDSHSQGQYQAALEQVNSILDSRHVEPEANLWLDLILATLREKAANVTNKIEADPDAANNYLRRAQLYHYLGDANRARLDMTRYRTLLGAPTDFVFGTPTNLGPPVNTSFDEGLPCISSDGLSLYFTS